MTTFLQFTGPVQTKSWQYCHSFTGDFSKTVDKTASTIVPVYSELFSHQVEATSENRKILAAIRTVLFRLARMRLSAL